MCSSITNCFIKIIRAGFTKEELYNATVFGNNNAKQKMDEEKYKTFRGKFFLE